MTSKARLFYSKELKSGLISKLSEEQSHYIKNVIRLKPNDKISLFNSINGEWDAFILEHGKNLTEFKIEKLSRPQEKTNNLWLAFSLIKKIPQDMKSVAIKVTIQAFQETLTDSELEEISANIIDSIEKKLSGSLRET